MSNLTLYKWKIYCSTDSKFEYSWLDEHQAQPTTCPTNTSHTISSQQTSIVETRKPDIININQEDIKTGEHFFWDTKTFTAVANTTTIFTFSYPMNISLIEASFVSVSENIGDSWSWVVAPNTTIGALTNNVSIDDTIINVTSNVTDNIKEGFWVNLFDGTNTEDLGRVLNINKTDGTITVEHASTQSFSAATPTFVRMNIYFLKDAVFGHPWISVYGQGKIKTSHVPANTIAQVEYTNNSPSTDKTITVYIEYMY